MSKLRPTRCFKTRGKKGELHPDPEDPPRRRANKAQGHGTYENDRPPAQGTVGRESGQVRLRVLRRTDGERLCPHVHGFTSGLATVYTDEWKGYSQVERDRRAARHGDDEWARDEDGDGIREIHVNTIEGPQATLRNFLRPFRGAPKAFVWNLAGYVAICEFAINLKRITPAFISALVRVHDF